MKWFQELSWGILVAKNKFLINHTCALHAKEQEHGYDCQECSNSVGYDIFKWVIIGNEQNVENRGGWQISRQ